MSLFDVPMNHSALLCVWEARRCLTRPSVVFRFSSEAVIIRLSSLFAVFRLPCERRSQCLAWTHFTGFEAAVVARSLGQIWFSK